MKAGTGKCLLSLFFFPHLAFILINESKSQMEEGVSIIRIFMYCRYNGISLRSHREANRPSLETKPEVLEES